MGTKASDDPAGGDAEERVISMMWSSNGMGWPMGLVMLIMAAGTLAFWVLVAILVQSVLLGGHRRTDSPPDTPQDAPSMTALDILDRRLASGEISVEEYASRRTIIRGRR